MRWIGLFTWDEASESLALPYPPALWKEERATVGGAARSAGNVLAGYTVRQDHRLHVPLRFTAAEWPQVRAMLAWAETGATVFWTPDVDAPATELEVTIDSPRAGESVLPEPDAIYPKLRTVTLVLMKADGSPFDLDYFAEP